MDKPLDVLEQPLGQAHEETHLERAVRLELQRKELMKSVCSSHRTAGTAPVPSNETNDTIH